MSNTILLKRSSTPGAVPTTAALTLGEVALNVSDGAMYFMKDNGVQSIVQVGYTTLTGDVTGAGVGSFATTLANSGVTAGTYNNVQVDSKGRVTAGSNAAYLVGNQSITVSGDATGTGTTAIALTLANSGVTAGTYDGSATTSTAFTVDAKGRITGVGSPVTITPAWSSITSTPTTLAGYGITDAQALNAKLTSIAALSSASTGLVKLTAGVASLDSSAYLTGNQTVTLSGDATGSGATAITVALAASGVTAGTYNNVATQVRPFTVDAKGRVTSIGTAVTIAPAFSSITGTPTTVAGYGITNAVLTTAVGAANGVASLDATGKVPTAQLPASVLGGLNYQGVWNATTNSPALASGVGTKGFYYVVSVAGNTTIDTFTNWTVGDVISFNGTTWNQVQGGSSDVSSVFGRVGAVTLTSSDVTTALTYTPYNATNPSGYISANQSITVSGDATGSGTTAIALTLANSGVTAGTYTKITVDAKGRATVGAALASSDVTTALTFTPYNATNPSGYISGNQTVTLSGDAKGSGATAITVALAAVGTAGTYTKVTTDAKGRVTAGTTLSATDIPNLDWAKITTGKPTTLAGYGITDAMASGMTIDGGSYQKTFKCWANTYLFSIYLTFCAINCKL